jgi:hypothetical protein
MNRSGRGLFNVLFQHLGEWTEENNENFSQKSHPPFRISNQWHPEYKAMPFGCDFLDVL